MIQPICPMNYGQCWLRRHGQGHCPLQRPFNGTTKFCREGLTVSFKMAEERHRHQMEQEKATIELEKDALSSAGKSIAVENSRSKLGLVFAFIIALAGIGTGAWLTAVGKAGFGMAFVFGPLVGLAAVFVYGTHARQSERRRMTEDDGDD